MAYRYIKEFSYIKNFPYQSYEHIRNYQFRKIKGLLNIAYYHTDFYHEKYDKAGIKPSDITSFKDFSYVPTITKEELIKYNEFFIDKRISKEKLIVSKSSGSSGKFVEIFSKPKLFIDIELQVIRMLKEFLPTYNQLDKEVLVYTSEYPVTSILNLYKVYYINNLKRYDEILSYIIDVEPSILTIYPSILREMINNIDFDYKKLNIKTIITNSEASTQEERNYFEKIFNCNVFDEFSSEELQSIFCQCKHKNYHEVSDSSYIEILNPNTDYHVGENEIGEIVGTCLLNTAMPIIRYRQGDLAARSNKQCLCGKQTPIYEKIYGRKNDSFIKQDGTIIPAGKILDWSYLLVLNHDFDIKEFKITQISYR